jgi:hypothetical protein
MKTILSFAVIFFAGLGFAVAEREESPLDATRISSAERTAAEPEEALKKFKIDIHPTYGLFGGLRTIPFIAGESMSFSARLARRAEKEDFSCDVMHELYDADGNLVRQFPEAPFKSKSAQFGCSTATESFFIQPEDSKPGKYRLKISIVDRESGNSEVQDYSFEILDKDTFGAFNIGFSSTPERLMPTGGNFTVGEPKLLVYMINGAAVENHRVHLKNKVTILDSKKQPIDAEPLFSDAYKPAPRSLRDIPSLFFAIRPDVPGEFFLRLEITDCVADKTATYDVPIKVSLPPGMDG